MFRFPDIQFSAIDSIADIVCGNSWRIPFHLSSEINDLLYQATRHILVDDISAPETLSWQGNSTGTLFLKEAWNLLRSHAIEIPWSDLIWNTFVNSHFASLSWHLLQRKTSTQSLAKKRGSSMASKCHNYFGSEESDLHLLFSCKLAHFFLSWLLSPCGTLSTCPLSVIVIWRVISIDKDVTGRKCTATIFFHAISVLWLLRNDSKHHNQKPSLEKASQVDVCRLDQGNDFVIASFMAFSSSTSNYGSFVWLHGLLFVCTVF